MTDKDLYDDILRRGATSAEDEAALVSDLHAPFSKFMVNWAPLRAAAARGQVPEQLAQHAALVSAALSEAPDPAEARNYAHLLDLADEGVDVVGDPAAADQWTARCQQKELPQRDQDLHALAPAAPPRAAELQQLAQRVRSGQVTTLGAALRGEGDFRPHPPAGPPPRLFADHPATRRVLTTYPELLARDPAHALLPALVLHWLAAPFHEAAREGAPFGPNPLLRELEELARGALRTAGLRKAEVAPVARAAQALEAVRVRLGTLPAVLAYHLHVSPLLSQGGLVELGRHVALLRKAAEGLGPPLRRVASWGGVRVAVGTAQTAQGDVPLLHDGGDHFVAQLDSQPVRLPKDQEGRTFQVVTPPEELHAAGRLDAVRDGVAELNRSPEQRALFHGCDPAAWRAEPLRGSLPGTTGGRWVRAGGGRLAYVKPSWAAEAANEVVFHNAAHLLGVGECVPLTAAFRDPSTGDLCSIQEGVLGAQHPHTVLQPGLLDRHAESGLLDKLAALDLVLGHADRGAYNYLVSDAGVHLVDNADLWGRRCPVPHYLHATDLQEPPHPTAAAWVLKADPAQLRESLEGWGVPPDRAGWAARRLQELQYLLAQKGASRRQVHHALAGGNG